MMHIQQAEEKDNVGFENNNMFQFLPLFSLLDVNLQIPQTQNESLS